MRRVGVCIAIVVLGVVLAAGTAGTQLPGPRAVLERLFTSERISADWFAPSFLADVAASRVEQIVADLKRTYGPFQRVEEGAGAYLVVLERATVPTRIALDAEGRIAGLFFQAPRIRVANLEQAVQALRALPGRVGLVVLADGQEQAVLNPDVPLAVGSAFKLAVLAALKEQIGSGQRSWREVVELRPEWKSLPSGILQNWPDGSFLSVQTLASLMISQSDNTATDILIQLVGRGAVEAAAPPRNRPFLTTREAFLLKFPRNQDLLNRYRTGNEAARRELLGELQRRPLPSVEEFGAALSGRPHTLDVEWFFTARELCSAIARVADLPLTGINPGVAGRRDWARVAYKGGSESGVLNLTTLVESRNRRTFCVAATWNHDAPVESARLTGLLGGILDVLK